MCLTLSSRVGADTRRPAGLTRRVSQDRSLMARCLAYLFGSGAALALFSLVLSDRSEASAADILIPPGDYAIAAVVVVAVLLINHNRLPLWTFHLTLAAGTALISFVIYTSRDPASAYTMLYVWVALYAFYFFRLPQAFLQVACVGIGYGLVLRYQEAVAVPAARWMITVGTVIAAGFLVAFLKTRVETLVERASDSARTDALTGLLNRRGFDECFDYELERARRGSGRLSLVLLDLDYFKEVNDRLGHAAGDCALERLGGVLIATKRQVDVAARVGGEEFALLLPDSDADGAFSVCERVRHRVRETLAAELPAPVERPVDRPLTVSLGIASFPVDGTSPAELLRAADRALYEAKRLGRDRTVAGASVTVS
jgi:diguanylate cyclase (GGDEF)-like protein